MSIPLGQVLDYNPSCVSEFPSVDEIISNPHARGFKFDIPFLVLGIFRDRTWPGNRPSLVYVTDLTTHDNLLDVNHVFSLGKTPGLPDNQIVTLSLTSSRTTTLLKELKRQRGMEPDIYDASSMDISEHCVLISAVGFLKVYSHRIEAYGLEMRLMPTYPDLKESEFVSLEPLFTRLQKVASTVWIRRHMVNTSESTRAGRSRPAPSLEGLNKRVRRNVEEELRSEIPGAKPTSENDKLAGFPQTSHSPSSYITIRPAGQLPSGVPASSKQIHLAESSQADSSKLHTTIHHGDCVSKSSTTAHPAGFPSHHSPQIHTTNSSPDDHPQVAYISRQTPEIVMAPPQSRQRKMIQEVSFSDLANYATKRHVGDVFRVAVRLVGVQPDGNLIVKPYKRTCKLLPVRLVFANPSVTTGRVASPDEFSAEVVDVPRFLGFEEVEEVLAGYPLVDVKMANVRERDLLEVNVKLCYSESLRECYWTCESKLDEI